MLLFSLFFYSNNLSTLISKTMLFTTFVRMQNASKIISGLLALYMLALVFMPCKDTCDSQQHHTITTVQSAQEHHEAENDICSPFCTCNCCASFVVIVNVATISTFFQSAVKDFPDYETPFYPTLPADHWQPPKLS